MSEERRDTAAGPGGQVKVNDKRRFRPDGEPIDEALPPAEPGAAQQASAAAAGAPSAGAATPPAPGPAEATVAAQAARIDELTRAYATLLEDNKAFRQRLERERVRVIEAERAGIAQALLETADELERALAAVTGVEGGPSGPLATLAEGVRLSLATLHKRISDLGAQRFATAGTPFDPLVAEAVDTVAVADEAQDGLVVQEVRPGYRIGDRVLRPARVRVGRLARA